MTRERREEVVLIALIASLAIHVGLMLLVQTRVMTRSGSQIARPVRREQMRVVSRVRRPDPAKIAEILDLKPVKDAPPVASDKTRPVAVGLETEVKAKMPEAPEVRTEQLPRPPDSVVKFDVRPVGRDTSAPVVPMTRIETPKATPAQVLALDFAVSVSPIAKAVTRSVSPGVSAPAVESFRLDARRTAEVPAFMPTEKVYEKVDEKVVAEEKAAVRDRMNVNKAIGLAPFVNVAITAAAEGEWRYFKVMVSPQENLKVVPKDVVLVIDGSGSIGKDRFAGCRKVAKEIMRSCMNSGDRFNLVVFRNAFSYAFDSWRECDAESFAVGDKWLSRQTAYGRTDVFSTISSVLTLPRDPKRPLIALVVTDGDANAGVSDTAEILSKFTALNDGLVSVYMYGVKSSANRELIDVLTHGNRGESFIFEGWRWNAGEGMEGLSERFRDPVLSDLRVIFATGCEAESYPRLLRNICRGRTMEFVGRVPAGTEEIRFSLRGLNGADAYEGFFRLPFETAASDPSLPGLWRSEAAVARKIDGRR